MEEGFFWVLAKKNVGFIGLVRKIEYMDVLFSINGPWKNKENLKSENFFSKTHLLVLINWNIFPPFYYGLIHRVRNQIYSFDRLLGRPQGSQGCQKMGHYWINLDLEVWCSNIEPKLNKLQKPSRSHQKWLIFARILQFFQFWLNIRAPNFQIQV